MSNGSFGVALTKCYYCGGDADVVINRHLTPTAAARVEAMHGKVASMEPCGKCKELMEKGVVIVSVRDGEQPPAEGETPNPYRTGMFTVVSDSWIMRIATSGMLDAAGAAAFRQSLTRRFMFVEDKAYDALGLPRTEVSEAGTETPPETPPEP